MRIIVRCRLPALGGSGRAGRSLRQIKRRFFRGDECPTDPVLEAYARDQLPVEDALRIDRHCKICLSCQERGNLLESYIYGGNARGALHDTRVRYLVRIAADVPHDYTCKAECRMAAARKALDCYRKEHPEGNVQSCAVFNGADPGRPALTLFRP